MARGLDRFTFGGRLPAGIGLVLTVTALASLFVAFGSRHAAPLFELASLDPAEVLKGQVWRLVTWPFIEPNPLSLLFGCLFLYWFGRDLDQEMGTRRFLLMYAGIVGASAVGTCLVALVDPAVMGHRYLGGWAPAVAMIVAWGHWFPHRVIRIWFVIPIRGYVLAWLAVAITIVFAIYSGWEWHLPELFAAGSMLAWLYQPALTSRVRRALRESKRREKARRKRESVTALRDIEADDEEPPSLPPELQGKIDDLLRPKNRGGP
jgi:membrane associated rhomboid family serine protease